jgi:hypothetical protein
MRQVSSHLVRTCERSSARENRLTALEILARSFVGVLEILHSAGSGRCFPCAFSIPEQD